MIEQSKQCSSTTNAFEQRADELDAWGDAERALAKEDVKDAGKHALTALARTAGAAVNVVVAAGKVVQGTARVLQSAGHLSAATRLATSGMTAAVMEKLGGLMRTPASDDCEAPKKSERFFAAARAEVAESGEALRASNDSYAEAGSSLVNGTANVALTAGHLAAVLGNGVQALGRTNTAAQLELEEQTARFWARWW